MLASQRELFDIPRDICFMNAAAWSPIPKSAVAAGKLGAERKSRPWEVTDEFADQQVERARTAAAKMINAAFRQAERFLFEKLIPLAMPH